MAALLSAATLSRDGSQNGAASPTLAALRLLVAEFPTAREPAPNGSGGNRGRGRYHGPRRPAGLPTRTRPFALVSQLYALVEDRTEVDRTLEGLARDGMVRRFKLASGPCDYAVMLRGDYELEIAAARERAAARLQQPEAGTGDGASCVIGSGIDHGVGGSGCVSKPIDAAAQREQLAGVLAAFEAFERRALLAIHGVSIGETELRRCMAGRQESLAPEKHVTVLVNAGLMTRQLASGGGFWLALPAVGGVVRQLVNGRREITQRLSKRPFREILRSRLEMDPLKSSALGWDFSLRDAIGIGLLTSDPSPSGIVLRLK